MKNKMRFPSRDNVFILFVFSAIVILYLLFPSHNYTLHDYFFFKTTTYRDISYILELSSPLFVSICILFNKLWSLLQLPGNAMESNVVLSTIIAIVFLVIFFRLLIKMNLSVWISLLIVCIISFLYVFWYLATSVNNLIFSAIFLLLSYTDFRRSMFIKAGVEAGIACMINPIHIAYVVTIIIILLLNFKRNTNIGKHLRNFILPVIILLVTYYSVFGIIIKPNYIYTEVFSGPRNYGVKEFFRWILKHDENLANRLITLPDLSSLFTKIGHGIVGRVKYSLTSISDIIFVGIIVLMIILPLILLTQKLLKNMKIKKIRIHEQYRVFFIWLGIYSILIIFWAMIQEYFIFLFIPLMISAGLMLNKLYLESNMKNKIIIIISILNIFIGIGILNLFNKVIPDSKFQNDPHFTRAMEMKKLTKKGDIIFCNEWLLLEALQYHLEPMLNIYDLPMHEYDFGKIVYIYFDKLITEKAKQNTIWVIPRPDEQLPGIKTKTVEYFTKKGYTLIPLQEYSGIYKVASSKGDY